MKLPKGFGGQGFGNVMNQMKSAMAQAQNLEEELANHRIEIKRELVQAVFNGRGDLISIKIDPALVDPDDIEGLEAEVAATVREGFEKANEVRDDRVKEITGGMPDLPGITG